MSFQVVSFFSETIFGYSLISTCAFALNANAGTGVWQMDADLNAGGMSCLCDFVFITFKLSQQFIILNDREHHSSNAMSFWNCERCCAGAWAARGFDMPCPRLGNARPSSCRGNLIS